MRLTNISEIEAFKAAIEACKGEVWLQSVYGDRFNLKSILSQYVALGKLLSEEGENLELFCQNSSDEKHFLKFFYEYPDTL
jgi:hypothetical protein